MKKSIILLTLICLLLSGCSKAPKPEVLNMEASGYNWTVDVEIPYTPEREQDYFKATFSIPWNPESLFSTKDTISFSYGTSIGDIIYTYHKTTGFIRPDDCKDPLDLERVTRISEDTFEVLFDMKFIDINLEPGEQRIVIAVDDDQRELSLKE